MQNYAAKRLVLALPVLFLVGLFVFLLVRLIPGDVIIARLGAEGYISPEQLQRLRGELGLDDPLPKQFIDWFGGVVRGDLGDSLRTGRPVRYEIGRALEPTVELGVMALVCSMMIGIPMGVISAIRRNSFLDYGARFTAIGGISLPDFWVGLMVIVLITRVFNWFPKIGFVSFIDDPVTNVQQLFLPALILGFRLSASQARMTRSTMLEVLGSDYIRTAWAKGLRERQVVIRHALRNALIPVLTILGGQMGILIGGTVIMETLFVIPGMGTLTVGSVNNRDYTQLQGNILVLASFIVMVNIIVDLSYGYLDPRIRQG